MRYLLIIILAFSVLISCNTKKTTRVVIKSVIKLHSVIQLERLGYNGEKDKLVDSAEVKKIGESLVFTINDEQPGIYKISTKDGKLKVLFVNDADIINVKANFLNEKYKVIGSPGYNAFSAFNAQQTAIATNNRALAKSADSLKQLKITGERYANLQKQYNAGVNSFFERIISFCDTVKNPAVFMWAYNTVELGNNFKRQKAFIIRATKRFPDYKPIQDLAKATLATISIYETEYVEGDKLPTISLPDRNGLPFNTSSLAGQYYLIDFWSTMCDQCMAFKNAESDIIDKLPGRKLQIVSVAIDNQKDVWEKMTKTQKANWTHLIDEKMWQGPAVQTLKFDSIPFNFLVSPQGKIIKTAIKPDSLMTVIERLVPKT